MSPTRAARLLSAGLLALAALLGVSECNKPAGATPKRGIASSVQAESAFDTYVKALDAGIARGMELGAVPPGNQLALIEVVGLHHERGQLTGDFADYAKAQALLQQLTHQGPMQGAECVAWARLHLTVHRLKAARQALSHCPAEVDAADSALVQGDLAMQAGQYPAAEGHYRAVVNEQGTMHAYARLALLKKWLGAPGEAAALLEAAEKRYHGGSPAVRAWLKLQRGHVALDQGRLDEAMALYQLAADALPGWWLTDSAIARALLWMGREAEAMAVSHRIQRPRDLATSVGDATVLARTDPSSIRAGLQMYRSGPEYDQALQAFPEAALAHRLEHALALPSDTAATLSMAQENYALRPNGEAAITLAKALLRVRKPNDAIAVLENQLRLGWDTPQAYWTLAQAFTLSQNPAEADQARRAALARNPMAETLYAAGP